MANKIDGIRVPCKLDARRKLTDEQKAEILELYKTGVYSIRELGRQFCISPIVITLIVNPAYAEARRAKFKQSKSWLKFYNREANTRNVARARARKRQL